MSSIAARAITFLRKHGKEASSAVIADAIDCDIRTVSSSLWMHTKAGGIIVRKEGHLNFWKLELGYVGTANGSARAIALPGDEPPDHDEPRQRTVKASDTAPIAPRGLASIFHSAPPAPASEPPTPFKRWLKKKGEPSEEAPRAAKKKPEPRKKAKTRSSNVVVVAASRTAAMPPPQADNAVVAGLRAFQHRRPAHRGAEAASNPLDTRADHRVGRLPRPAQHAGR